MLSLIYPTAFWQWDSVFKKYGFPEYIIVNKNETPAAEFAEGVFFDCPVIVNLLFELFKLLIVVLADNGIISGHVAADLFVPGGACGIPLVNIRNAGSVIQAGSRSQIAVCQSPGYYTNTLCL